MIYIVLYLFISAILYLLGNYIDKHGNRIKTIKSKTLFYLLSFTWGLPMNLIGAIVALILKIKGYTPKKYGWFYNFELDVNFGLELGIFIITPKDASLNLRNHECGHGVQNIYLGIFTPMVVCLPSAIRFHFRELVEKLGKENKTGYYDIWFEHQASELGTRVAKNFEKESF